MKNPPYINVSKTKDGLIFLGSDKGLEDFEGNYLAVREKEGRIFSDQLVLQLPYLPSSHPLRNEWLHRAATLEMFVKYLKPKKGLQNILDLGCGNGWFSRQLAAIQPAATVFGLDVNLIELQQATRLFGKPHARFLYGDIFQDIFIPESFDLIVLNSAIQYFFDIKLLINRLLELLAKNGEIHLLDSPFYSTATAQNEARKRSADYFLKMGVKDMNEYYYHHIFNDLKDFSSSWPYKPGRFKTSLLAIFGKKPSLFPWVCIRK